MLDLRRRPAKDLSNRLAKRAAVQMFLATVSFLLWPTTAYGPAARW